MPMFKKSLIILLVLALATLCGTMYGYYTQQETIVLDEGTSAKAETPRTIIVYVTGEVKKPGLVSLTEGQRVADAVNAVGGVIETADIDRVNMAALLEDGMQIRVPERIAGSAEGAKAPIAGKNAERQINLNTASEKELQELPESVLRCLHALLNIAKRMVPFKRLKTSKRCAASAMQNLKN